MSPQTQRADDAKIWHARGMDARFHSLQIRDPEKRLLLLQIAHSYELLAQQVEGREPAEPSQWQSDDWRSHTEFWGS
jgi:hypothetical protein